MSRRVYHKQGPAPLSLCTRNTTASRSISDHKNCGRPCRDKPVLAQKGAGGGGPDTRRCPDCSFLGVQAMASRRSPLTRRHLRNLSESRVRAIQCYDCPDGDVVPRLIVLSRSALVRMFDPLASSPCLR